MGDNRTDPRGSGSALPAYSALTDPYCAKFARRLYNKKAFEHTAKAAEESDHDFYKRREQQASNCFQRARRRSIELIEEVEGKHTKHTESSRRRSVELIEPFGDDTGSMKNKKADHAQSAAAAAAWFEAQQESERTQGIY